MKQSISFETPLLSVVMPVFNRQNDLNRALLSLVSQTNKNFEVIVIDDGSTEDIESLVNSFKTRLSLTFSRIENSGGPARPRNIGIQLANSSWVSFLDSDDWWYPQRVSVVLAEIQSNTEIDIFYHRLKITSENPHSNRWSSKSLGKKIIGDPFIYLMTKGDVLPNSSVILKRSCYEKFGAINESLEFSSVEDYDYWLFLAQNKCTFKFINLVLGCYWVGPDGISAPAEKTIHRNNLVLQKYLAKLNSNDQLRAKSRFYYSAGSKLYSVGRYSDSLEYFRLAKDLPDLAFKFKRFLKMARVIFWMS